MSWRNTVVWSQGMFLQPHHFQQEARYTARLVDSRARCLSPHAWGVSELVLDDAMLALGRVGIARASGVLSDGTPFAIPQLDAPPAPLEIPSDLGNERIFLALPLSREGITEVDFGGSDELCRITAVEESLRDHSSASDEPATIQTGRLALRLLREREATDAYALIAVAHVVERRSDAQVVLDRSHIAAQTNIAASEVLLGSVRLLHGLVAQRAQALAARMGQGQLSHGISELADFLMLQSLNRAEPLLRQHALAPSTHPAQLFADCLQLAGELSTFTSANRRPPDFPLYQHEDLRACFTPLFDELRRMLSVTLQQNALQIELVDRKHGVRTAVVSDIELARSASFVFAVKAQMPHEQLRQLFVAQTKVGPVDRIRDLVNLQLPGLALQTLPVAPRQLPYHAGFFYFEIERAGDLWRQFEKSGSLALHIAGDFPALELQLWAIRA